MFKRRKNIPSGAQFEESFGYSHAVKVGKTIYISGTVGIDYGSGTISKDPVEQLHQIIQNIEPSLLKAGAKLADIVQVSTYIASQEVFEVIGPVLGNIFGEIRPTNTLLIVDFPVPEVMVEIAATAVIGCGYQDISHTEPSYLDLGYPVPPPY